MIHSKNATSSFHVSERVVESRSYLLRLLFSLLDDTDDFFVANPLHAEITVVPTDNDLNFCVDEQEASNNLSGVKRNIEELNEDPRVDDDPNEDDDEKDDGCILFEYFDCYRRGEQYLSEYILRNQKQREAYDDKVQAWIDAADRPIYSRRLSEC